MAATPLDENSLKPHDDTAERKETDIHTAGQDVSEGKGLVKAEDSSVYIEPMDPNSEKDDALDRDEPAILQPSFSRTSFVPQTPSYDDHNHQFPLTDLDRGIVGWDGPDDPENPINFPRPRKFALLALVSAITFVSPLASSMFAPAVGFLARDFGVKEELLLSFTVSVYLLGYVVSSGLVRKADLRT